MGPTTKEKILIIVRGGVVQAVFASDKNLEVDILDFDNEQFPKFPSNAVADNEVDARSNGLYPII